MSFNKVDEALKSVGITLQTTDHQFRSFTDVILELTEVWDKLDSAQQRYIATQFAGNRQQSRFLALVSNKDLLQANLRVAEESEDTGTLQALKALDSIESKLNQVQVAYQQFYTNLGVESVWKTLLDGTKNFINSLNNLPKAFGKIPTGAILVITDLIGLIKQTAIAGLSEIAKIWKGNLVNINNEVQNQANENQQNGEKWVNNFVNGIKNNFTKIKEAVTESINKANEVAQQEIQSQRINGISDLLNKYNAQTTEEGQSEVALEMAQKYKISIIDAEQIVANFKGEVDSTIPSILNQGAVLNQTGDSALSFKEKIAAGAKGLVDYAANSNTLSSTASQLGMALNMVAMAIDTTSQSGKALSGTIMMIGGVVRAGIPLFQYFSKALTEGFAVAGPFPIVAAISGAIALVNGLATAIETSAEKLERLQKQAEDLSNTAKQIKADEKTFQSDINKVEELKVKRYESAEAANEYQTAVEDLAEKFPELILGFDEAGNTILDLESAEDALAEARKKTLQATYDAVVAESEAKQQEVENAKETVRQLQRNYEDSNLRGLTAIRSGDNESITEKVAGSLTAIGSRPVFAEMLAEYGKQLYGNGLSIEELVSSSENLTALVNSLANAYSGIDTSFEINSFKDFEKAIANVINPDEAFKELVNGLKQVNEGITEDIRSDVDIITSFVANLDSIDFATEEGAARYTEFKQAYNNLDKEQKDYFNAQIFNVDELIKNIDQIVSSSNQSRGINNSLISSYLQLTKANEKGWEFLEENNQARLLLTNQLTETWMNSDEYKNKTWEEFKSSDDFKNAVNEFYEAYNQLGEDKQKLLEEIETDTRSYTAQDIKRMLSIGDDENNPINKYIDSLYKTAEESKKQIDEIFKDYDKVQWDDKKLKFDLTPISQLQNGLSKIQENLDFPPEVISFINARAKEINQLTKDGFVQSAQRLSDQTLTFLSTLYGESMGPQERAVVMAILNSTNLQTKEGIDEAIEQIQNSDIDDADQKAVIEQLETRKKELIDNVALSIQADLAQLVEEAEDDSKLLSKATSGLSVKETNELIQQAQSWGVNLSLKDFIPNGDKLIASENAFNKMQQGYQSKLKAAGDKAQENLDKAKSLDLYDGNNFSIPELLTEDQLKFFEQQLGGFSTDMANFVDGDTTRLSEVGREKVEEIYKTISDSLFEYGESIGILFQTIFGEANWNKGDYSSLRQFTTQNITKTTGSQPPEFETIFDADEFNKYLTGESKYDAQTDPNLKAAVEKARGGVSTFLSDLLSKGADGINISDYAESGIEASDFEQMKADFATIGKDSGISYQEFVQKYAAWTGGTIEEINNFILQAIQQDNKTSEAAQKKAFSDLTIVGDIITGTEEQINALATALGNTNVSDLLGKKKADDSYEVIITEAVRKALDNLNIIEESIPNQLKTFSDNLSKAADYITKGSNDTAAMQQFADEYAKVLGGEAGDYSWKQLFSWDSNTEAYTLSADAYKAYIQTQKDKLSKAGEVDEEVAHTIEEARKQFASTVDIDSFLKAENREVGSQAYNKLADQMRDYYSTIYDSEEEVNGKIQSDLTGLLKGGITGAQVIQKWAEEKGREATASEIEQGYRAEISQLENAFDQLSYGVGSLISGQAVDILEAVGYEIDRIEGTDSAVIKSIGDVADAYEAYYNELKKTNEATIAALNEAYAKVLETRDDSDVIAALGDAASMTYTRLGEILASKGIELTDELLAQYSDTIQSIGGGKVRITNFDRFATEIMQWTDIDKNSEEYVSAFKTYNDSLINMNRKAERNILEEVSKLNGAGAGDWVNLTQLMSKMDQSMSEIFEKRYFSDFNYTGNVDISKRPIISPEKMRAAGYEDFDGDYATLYSTTFSFGDAIENLSDCLDIVATPIQDLNTVLSDEELATYIESLVNSTDGSVEAILAADAAQRNLILGMFEGEEVLSQANQEYGEKLHEFSEDWVNNNPIDNLNSALSQYGAIIEDGILKIDEEIANVPAIMSTLVTEVEKFGILSAQEEAELLDTLNANLKSYSDAISNAIKGTATNAEIQKISDWANSLGIQIDFTKTVNGLKLSQESATKLYNELKKVDYLQSQLVFKELSDSLKENNSNYKDMSSILARIKTLEEEIDNPNVSTARREEYKRELELAKEIKETRALTDPDSFNFMGNDISDAMKGAENYWNSWGNAFKAMNEAGKSGYMGITDFYNIVNEMNNLAKMSGNTLTFMGKELSGDAEDAAKLIQEGMGYLANVDGSGVSVALKKFGSGFAKDAAGMQTNVKAGIKAMAESQIEMLDAQIQLLETIVAMEQLGAIDVNGNGIFDLTAEELGVPEDDGFIKKFGKSYARVKEDIIKYFNETDNNELKKSLNSVKISGHTINEILAADEKQLEHWGIKGKTLQGLLQALYELSQTNDFGENGENVTEVIKNTLEKYGVQEDFVVDTGKHVIGVTGSYEWDWDSANLQEAIKQFGKDTEENRNKVKEAVENYNNNNAQNEIEVRAALIAKGVINIDDKTGEFEVNGKKYNKDNISTAIGEAVLKDKIPDIKDIHYDTEGRVTGVYKVNSREISVTYDEGKISYHSDILNQDFSSIEALRDAEWKHTLDQFYKGYIDNPGTKEEWLEKEWGIQIKYNPKIETQIDSAELKQQAIEASNKPVEEVKAALDEDGSGYNRTINEDGTVTYDLNGIKVTVNNVGSLESQIAAAQSQIQSIVDPEGLVTKISEGIKNAFTDDPDNAIGKAIGDGIVAAMNDPENFKDKDFSVPTANATLDEVIIDDVVNAKFADDVWTNIKKGITGLFGGDTSDLTIPEATAKVETLTLSKPTTTNFTAIEEGQSNATIDNLTADVTKLTLNAPTETDASAAVTAATTAGQDINAGLVEGMSDTTAITEKAAEVGTAAVDAINTAAGTHSPSIITTQTGKDLIAGLVAGLSDEAARTSAVSQATSLAQQIIDAIQSYFNQNPLSLSANLNTPETPAPKNSSAQVSAPSIDISGITALQNAIATISTVGISTAAEIQKLSTNLLDSTTKATDFETALSNISDNGKTKAEDFETALSAIGDNGKNKADEFETALSNIKDNGKNKADEFQDALSKIGDNGKKKADDFSAALDSIKQDGINYTNNFKNSVNDIEPSGASIAHAFKEALNGIYSSGPSYAENFKSAVNNMSSSAASYAANFVNAANRLDSNGIKVNLDINVNVKSSGDAQATGYRWQGNYSYAKGNQGLAYSGGKDTLMGELGPELVVSHGRYFLVGQNGPEMVNLDDDAIVFNHLQTKKLIEKGKINSRGTPVTNERKATSMAIGNVEGPALASASEVLAMLKQLREMWRSLRDATIKDLGINAGKAGKTKDKGSGKTSPDKETKDTEKYTAGIESNVERWYNWLQAIEATQNKINKLTKEYNILEKEGVSTQEKLKNLQQQYKLRQENKDTEERLAKEQIEYRNDVIDKANQGLMSAFYQADKETGQVYLANDDAFQKYVNEQRRKGLAVGVLSNVMAQNGAINEGKTIKRELSIEERKAKAEEAVQSSYGRQSRVPSYLKQYYKNGELIEGKEEEAKKAAEEEFKSSKYTKSVQITRTIKTGLDFMEELQAQDDAGNLVHDAADQLALIKQMGLFTEDLMTGIDTATEGWEAQVVQRFYDKVEGDKESIESLTDSIREQELAALDDAAAMEEINEKIRSITKVASGVTDGLEKWYNEIKKIQASQQEINKLVKEMELLQKDQKINGDQIYQSLKNQENSIKNQIKLNDDLITKRKKEAQELKNRYKDLPIVVDQNGLATFSEKAIGAKNGVRSVTTSYTKVKTNAQGYEVDVNGNYRDKEGNLRDKSGKIIEGNFGELAVENVTGHKNYNFANKNIIELLNDLTSQDIYGETNFKAQEQYQILKAAGLEKYMQYDEKGNKIYDDFGALTQEEMEKAVSAAIKRIQNSVNEINTNNDEIVNLDEEQLKLQSDLLSIQQQLIDNQIEVEKMVKDAIEQLHQDAIDAKKELKDALDEASSRTIEGLQNSLDAEKSMYEKTENENQLAVLQRQLEVAQRSGASMSKIQSLQQQVADAQKDMYFTNREQLIDNIENSMQREIEALDTQISIMEATFEYQKENGLLWAEINEVLKNTPAAIIDFISQHTPALISASETDRLNQLNTIGDKITEFKAYQENKDKKEQEAKVEVETKSENTPEQTTLKNEEKEVKTQATVKADNSEIQVIDMEDDFVLPEVKQGEIIDDPSWLALNLDESLKTPNDLVWEETWNTNKNKKYDPNKKVYGIKDTIDKAKKIAREDPSISENDIIKALQQKYADQIVNKKDSPAYIAKMWNGWSDSTLRSVLRAELKKNGKVPKFKEGGDIDFSGLAWVDGTKKEPEHIFNFQQMEALRAHLLNGVDVTRQAISGLSDTLNQIPNINTYNSINNTTDSGISIGTLEFHMEVAEIANDYDARRAGEQAMNEIVRIARKSGTRSLSRR